MPFKGKDGLAFGFQGQAEENIFKVQNCVDLKVWGPGSSREYKVWGQLGVYLQPVYGLL